MARNKKITVTDIMNVVGKDTPSTEKLTLQDGDSVVEIEVKKRLTVSERARMVDDIVDMVFIQNEDGTEQYFSYLKRFACSYSIVSHFTNVSLSSSVDKMSAFLEKTHFDEMIADFVGTSYVGDIIDEAVELIEFRKQEILKKSKFDELLESIFGVIHVLKEKTEGMNIQQIMELMQSTNPELTGQFEQLIKNNLAGTEAK